MDWQKLWNDITTFFSNNWLNMIWFVLALVLGIILIKIICSLLSKGLAKKMDRIVSNFIVVIVKFCLCMVLVFVLAGIMNINTTGLVAVISAAGLTLSLSLQDSLSNVASGMLIVSQKPFKEKDYVEIDGVGGQITRIGVFTTELVTFDNRKITLPNRSVTSSPIVNYDAMPTRRVDIKFKASLSCEIDKIKAESEKIIYEDPRTQKGSFTIVVDNLDGGVAFVIKYWVDTADYWDSLFLNNEKIFKMLQKLDVALNVSAVRLLEDRLSEKKDGDKTAF
ncbi:small-conductance mechanosensitive channel [Subdoligranulum sp. CAG:314]|jgi:Small-conductance mechanosensitive channel|nr:small-conductance mechanosensitive channel [Subdoligranulum sp. CAG:314]